MIRRLLSLPIRGEHTPILAVDVLTDDSGCVYFIADGDIDCDGSGGNPENDPYFQPDTTYHHNGVALDAYKVRFGVVPASIIKAVKGIVLGCKMKVTNLVNGKSAWGIVGDIGPSFKLGEISPAFANALGIPASPNTGGVDDYNALLYELWPGEAIQLDGVKYGLQPMGST